MQKKLIVANWKMNGSMEKVQLDLMKYSQVIASNQDNVVLALPYVYLGLANQVQAKFCLASQDMSRFAGNGAYTGEVSALMLKELNASYAIIGHSERRSLLNESGTILVNKIENAIDAGIIPIFCIGEEFSIRANGRYIEFLVEQLDLLNQLTTPINELVIAYEPVWSIGTGNIPTIEQISEIGDLIHAFVQKSLPHVKITVLYGGSVSAKNISEILHLPQITGVLVGGASLKPDEFIAICEHA